MAGMKKPATQQTKRGREVSVHFLAPVNLVKEFKVLAAERERTFSAELRIALREHVARAGS
jgi:hypothetical protein